MKAGKAFGHTEQSGWQTINVAAEDPKISVIIPCYNLEAYVSKAIESVLEQSVDPLDIVVVDNGSTDDSAAVIGEYVGQVKLVTLQPNQGVSVARNKGAECAAGNWYMFLDADDYLNQGALEAFLELAKDGGSGVVFGSVSQHDIDSGEYSKRDNRDSAGAPPWPAVRGFWRSSIATPGSAIVHRSVHNAIGGFEKPWQPTEDRDYWMKCGVTTSFRYLEYPVMTKLKRMDSMRIYSDRAILWGMRVQFEFLDWCRARGIDTGFLNVTSQQIIDHAVKRVVRQNEREVLREIMAYCASRGISSGLLKRYKVYDYFRTLFKN